MTTLREFIEKLQEIGDTDPTRLDLEVRLYSAKHSQSLAAYRSAPAHEVGQNVPFINVWSER